MHKDQKWWIGLSDELQGDIEQVNDEHASIALNSIPEQKEF